MTLITAALALIAPPIEPDAGYVSRYDAGVFQSVIEVRIERGYGYVPPDWQSYDGYLAVLDCSTVGQEVWARPGKGYPFERLLIADCAGDASTVYWFTVNGIVGELDYETFFRWVDAGYMTEKGLTVELRPVEWWYEQL
jgi:hypothetical protein